MIDQGARLVDIALDNGSAFELDGWKYISESFPDNTVHFIGLLSDGGVHSRCNQLVGFLKGAAKDGAKRIRVHILTVSHPPTHCPALSLSSSLPLPCSACSKCRTAKLPLLRVRQRCDDQDGQKFLQLIGLVDEEVSDSRVRSKFRGKQKEKGVVRRYESKMSVNCCRMGAMCRMGRQ